MFLHLISLPTINHIDLSYIRNFLLSSLTSSVNLLWLDILCLTCFKYFDREEDNCNIRRLEKICEDTASESATGVEKVVWRTNGGAVLSISTILIEPTRYHSPK